MSVVGCVGVAEVSGTLLVLEDVGDVSADGEWFTESLQHKRHTREHSIS